MSTPHLAQEIAQQPTVIARLLAEASPQVAQVAQAIRDFNPTFVAIAARGTSDNAARYAQYAFGVLLGLPVMLAAPSLHTLYQSPPNLARALVIGISQSGQAEDVRRVLQDARQQGALTLAVTNYDDSPMAQTAAHHLALLADEEVSIAATKTYTAQLTLLAMLASALADRPHLRDELAQLPDLVQTTLDLSANIADWAERYRYTEKFAVLGRGYNYCTAFEISLKVNELAYIATTAYSEADFRHGPIAMVQTGFPVMLIAPQGALLDNMRDLAQKLGERGAERIIISNDPDTLAYGHKAVRIPQVAEWLSPMICVIPGQVFAMHQALTRGYPVDKPRGLSKVTITE
jgi:glucosamine--fructose-6-phosphate aminotransferase (isomerizing)